MKSKILLICLFVSAFLGNVKAKSPPAPPAKSNAPATSEEPRYLIFWSSPEKAGELAERVGMKGDGKTRILGFGLPNATFELEKQLPEPHPECIRRGTRARHGGDAAFRFPSCLEEPPGPLELVRSEQAGLQPEQQVQRRVARLGRTAEQGALPEPRCARTPAAEHVLYEQENAGRGHADRLKSHRAGPPRGDCETQGRRQGSPFRGSVGGFGARHRRLLPNRIPRSRR